ncbi:hypothetical protein AX16_001080 [Volvariella volvacea WC 439]|nr:hypothetical protein AX16_001080 [Volvariella volvacea WC 439]
MSPPEVDLIITFRATRKTSLPKQQLRQDATKAERQYSKLLDTLTYAGLKAVGRRGEALGHLLVFVTCPREHVVNLIKRERESDFLSGLPVTPVRTGVEANRVHLSPADRLRLVYSFVTSMPSDGGLGITPGVAEWDMVESVMALHDKEFNEAWVKLWSIRDITTVQLDKIREQFGEPIALYFAFLSSYTTFLIFPAALGVISHFFYAPYSATYSLLLLIWSTVFTEWWRVHERILSLRWGTRGSFRVEKRRAQYKKETISGSQNGALMGSGADLSGLGSLEGGTGWWRRELKVLASLPVILTFAGVLFALLTAIFVFEAFVAHLYTGPGNRFISLAPTLAFVALVPRFLAIYQSLARSLTDWENHAHESTYEASLTIKTFIMSAIVAYGGLALSAFVYVPFGEGIMAWVQNALWIRSNSSRSTAALTGEGENLTSTVMETLSASGAQGTSDGHHHHHHHHHHHESFWEMDRSNARRKLNPSRLKDQMFAYTVTNQIVNTFVEVGLPFVMRDVVPYVLERLKGEKAKAKGKGKIENGKRNRTLSGSGAPPSLNEASSSSAETPAPAASSSSNATGSPTVGTPMPKKRVIFEDEQEKGGLEEREYLDHVRAEVALPEYTLFEDYNEMVVQFGYVVLWSGIWYLAPVMALINNIFEIRSDAFKITVHHRRPLSAIRTDTIGPWLDAMTFLTWLGALCNSALVYLFRPPSSSPSFLHPTPSDALGSASGMETFSAPASQSSIIEKVHRQLFTAAGATVDSGSSFSGSSHEHDSQATKDLLITALVIALAASHGYMILKRVVSHVVEKLYWAGSVERVEREMDERVVRERFLGIVSGTGSALKKGEDGKEFVEGTSTEPNGSGSSSNPLKRGEPDSSILLEGTNGDFSPDSPEMMREEDMRDIEDEINDIETVDGTTVVGEGTVIDPFSPRPEPERELEEPSKGKAVLPLPVPPTVDGWDTRFWDHDEGLEEIHRIVKEA